MGNAFEDLIDAKRIVREIKLLSKINKIKFIEIKIIFKLTVFKLFLIWHNLI